MRRRSVSWRRVTSRRRSAYCRDIYRRAGTLKFKKEAQASLDELKAKSKERIKLIAAVFVSASIKAEAKAADALAAAGDHTAAAKVYGELYARSASDAALLYAQGQCYRLAGEPAKAKEALNAYLAVSGKLKFKAEATAAVTDTSYKDHSLIIFTQPRA